MARARRQRSNPAFTLVELLAAITVIAILSTMAIGAVRGARERSSIARARAELASLAAALEDFKRLYGDYPQTGEFVQPAATPASPAAGPGLQTAPAKLFNCLTGVFGPRGFTAADRLNGPNLMPAPLLDPGRINGTLTSGFLVPASNPTQARAKHEEDACLLDPWGRRYVYYYKHAGSPHLWQAPGYVLYSAGRTVAGNGEQTPPIAATTGLRIDPPSAETMDNVYANP